MKEYLSSDQEKVKSQLSKALAQQLEQNTMTQAEVQSRIAVWLDQLVNRLDLTLDDHTRQAIIAEVISETLGLGPLQSLLADQNISEIMVSGPARFISNAMAACRTPTSSLKTIRKCSKSSTESSGRWAARWIASIQWSMPAWKMARGLTSSFRRWRLTVHA